MMMIDMLKGLLMVTQLRPAMHAEMDLHLKGVRLLYMLLLAFLLFAAFGVAEYD